MEGAGNSRNALLQDLKDAIAKQQAEIKNV